MKIEELIQIIENFSNLCETYEAKNSILKSQISEYDRSIQKILHEIEYTKLNASQGYKIAKELQVLCIDRRKLKKEAAALCSFHSTFLKDHKNIGVLLYKTIKNLQKPDLGGTDYELVEE